MNLREAAQQALETLSGIESPMLVKEIVKVGEAIHALRAALAEEAMQRLTDVQQEIENGANTVQSPGGIYSRVFDSGDRNVEAVTNCHRLEQARAVVISNLLAHFSITSADSDVNLAYLNKQLDDLLAASIGCNKEGNELAPPLKRGEKCDYPWCLSSNGCGRQCPAFPRCEDSDTGKKSDVPETNFGSMAQVVDSTGGDHSEDAREMMASVREDRTVDPVGYFSINSYGNWEQNESGHGTPLYDKPPKREPLTEKQIEASVCGAYVEKALTRYDITIARAIEQAHGIGGEE